MVESVDRTIGQLEKGMELLTASVGSLTEEVQGLRDDLNQRKGARKAFYALSAFIGGTSGALGAWLKSVFVMGAQ